MERLALHAFESEDRHVDDGDDQDAEKARLDHLGRCAGRQLEAFLAIQQSSERMLRLAEPAETVLDDDDRTVHDQAEVQCPQAHQVARHVVLDHPRDHQEEGEGDHGSGDERSPEVAEQDEQDDDDQQRSFGEVFLDCGDRCFDQFGAIVDRIGDNAAGQRAVYFLQPFGHRDTDIAGILANEHVDRAEHDFAAILGCGAIADLGSDLDIRNISDTNGNPIAVIDNNPGQIAFVLGLSGYADKILRTRPLDVAGTDIGIVVFERLDHVLDRQTETGKTFGKRRYDILLTVAAD